MKTENALSAATEGDWIRRAVCLFIFEVNRQVYYSALIVAPTTMLCYNGSPYYNALELGL